MNQSQFLANTCNSLEAREKSRVDGAIGFGFASHWLKNWRKSFKPITRHSNRNHLITLISHWKTSLMLTLISVTEDQISNVVGEVCGKAISSLVSSMKYIFLPFLVEKKPAICY